MRSKRTLAWVGVSVAAASCAGCASHGLEPAARINHVVLFELRDPADAPALIADCREKLGEIPGVTAMFVGEHFESGRATVVGDYDVGLYVGLDSAEAYQGYLAHPNHMWLVDTWRDRFVGYRVFDIEDTEAE